MTCPTAVRPDPKFVSDQQAQKSYHPGGDTAVMSKKSTINLEEWISVAEAAARIPSPYAGKTTSLGTVYNLIKRHKLPVLRRGCWTFIRWQDVVALFKPGETDRQAEHEEAERRLRAEGFL